MAVLRPQSFSILVRRLMEEPQRQDACFDLPRRRWWIPAAQPHLDFSVEFHGLHAGTPFGPAAGPHAQMAQNILLSWLAGSRIIELKTIQVLDDLDIPRPCIDIRNIGFNIEWSQELTLEQSAREYAAGALLVAFARAENLLGLEGEAATRPDPVVFDLSVGYDLKGVQSRRVVDTLRSLGDARPLFNLLRCEIPEEYASLREIAVDPVLVRTATISTFHGCPPEEIEGIATFLVEEFGLHTVVKLNPTLLGRERVEALLHTTLGYKHLSIPSAAFDNDLKWEESLDLARRLEATAHRCGVRCGVKFSNTLVVENDEGPLPRKEKHRYLSGAPLHVLTLTLADEWRRAAHWRGALSFSAGIDKYNASDAVACGFVPVTTCTDLLKLGGYGRLPEYLAALGARMKGVGAADRDDFLLRVEGQARKAIHDIVERYRRETLPTPTARALAEEDPSPSAERLHRCRRDLQRLTHILDPRELLEVFEAVFGGDTPTSDWNSLLPEDLPLAEVFFEDVVRRVAELNHEVIAKRTREDARYRFEHNKGIPKRLDSHLALFDCINCDKCILACPNAAIFCYEVNPEERALTEGGAGSKESTAHTGSRAGFAVKKKHQLAILADWCNECGNCDTYCPEQGGPFVEKPGFYGSLESMLSDRRERSFCYEAAPAEGAAERLHAWLGGRAYCLEYRPEAVEALLRGGPVPLRLSWPDGRVIAAEEGGKVPTDSTSLVQVFHTLRVLLQGVVHGPRINNVSATSIHPGDP